VENDLDALHDSHNSAGLCIRHGIILNGRLSKASLGATNRGIIQSVWRLYGPGGAHKFISDAQRMFVKHLAHDGTSQSIMDYLINSENKIMKTLSRDLGRSDAILNLNLPNEIKEAKSMAILQETLRAVGSGVLTDIQTDCALADCVNSGSKGNVMNIAQICGCVGQQTIYGKRIPIKKTRLGPRTLIYYAPGDMRAESRGFIANSYIRGLSPIETFEHQMAGREGIVATAVNTSETGYNQRRMIKGQESQKLSYDGMVRVSDNKVVQTSYGGDDLDGSKLERIKISWISGNKKFPFYIANNKNFVKALKMARAYASWNANTFKTLDLTFSCAVSFRGILNTTSKRSLDSSQSLEDGQNESIILDKLVNAILKVHAKHHASSQSLWNTSIMATVLQAAEFWFLLTPKNLEVILKCYNRSIINPGEGVGALGASSIGEPGMQKTLNTFHYAGIADKNVTITGLPRFKQLINGIDTYEFANMTADIKNFELSLAALQISKVMLFELLDCEIESEKYSYTKSDLEFFKSFENQRGPFYSKFACDAQSKTEKIILQLNWTLCARKNISIESISKSLQTAFSYDALILKWPQWTYEKNSRIEIILAPWISYSRAICESLKSHHQVRGIDYVKNAIVFQETRYTSDLKTFSRHVVETEGSNVIDLACCSFVNAQTIRTNNVLEIFSVLGITAGIFVLQSELHKVLSFDGSYIDPRHTWLLADTMGRNGSLAAMNRHHMIELGSSLLQEASFERSLEVFEEGAAHDRHDDLINATERIIVRQPVIIGTGMVECISTQIEKNVQSVFIAPMAMTEDIVVEEIVEKLFKPENSDIKFEANVFGKQINEFSKDSGDSFFIKCIGLFRQNAAERRIAPNMKFTTKLTESKYRNALASCYAYNFSLQKSSSLVTEVHWKSNSCDQEYGITIIEEDKKESYLVTEIFNETSNYRRCQIYMKKAMETKGPFGVESTRVLLRQQTTFEKGHFSLILARQWIGNTIAEAEESLLKNQGSFIGILEIIESDSILQNRSSNIQLANCIEMRIPF
jgi:DNA-directed RNA polymerase II subunit RPB1